MENSFISGMIPVENEITTTIFQKKAGLLGIPEEKIQALCSETCLKSRLTGMHRIHPVTQSTNAHGYA